MLVVGLLLVGKPEPLQVTVAPVTLQPEISWLAGLMVTPLATRSAIAFGILPPQSPLTELQFGVDGAGNATVRVAHIVALPLIGAKEKNLVFDNCAAQAAAKLLQRALILGGGRLPKCTRSAGAIEIVSRIEYVAITAERES